MTLIESASALNGLAVRHADGHDMVFVGIDVLYGAGTRPLPVIYISWAEADPFQKVYGPTSMNLLRIAGEQYSGGKQLRNLRHHDLKKVFEHGGWHVPGMLARFHYRDTDDDEILRISIDAPQMGDIYLKGNPEGTAWPADFDPKNPARFVTDVKLSGFDAQMWFAWKNAYQGTGTKTRNPYYLLRYGVWIPERREWDHELTNTRIPYFVMEDIDFSEVGDYQRLAGLNEDGKQKLRRIK